MSDVLRKQVGSALAQVELLRVMLLGMQDTLGNPSPRAEEAPLLPTCAGIGDEFCARRNPDAHLVLGRESQQHMCRGCGLDPRLGS